jgi:16S rRNA (guanine(966)-N(2))-methyltransferase RsmD
MPTLHKRKMGTFVKKKKTKATLTILGGSLKGEKIILQTDDEVRPTRQLVREAVFQIWADRIVESIFFDPFAGSGAVVLEALSRGAEEIYASDIKPDILFSLRKRLRAIEKKRPGLAAPSRIILSAEDYKNTMSSHFADRHKFDLIYLDPPYNSGYGLDAIRLIARYQLLHDDGRILLEVSKRERGSVERFIDEDIALLMKKYTYGETHLYHFCLDES